MPEASAAKKPVTPATDQIANYIREKFDFKGKAVPTNAAHVMKGDGDHNTVISITNEAIQKIGGDMKKFTTMMTGLISEIDDDKYADYKAEPKQRPGIGSQ